MKILFLVHSSATKFMYTPKYAIYPLEILNLVPQGPKMPIILWNLAKVKFLLAGKLHRIPCLPSAHLLAVPTFIYIRIYLWIATSNWLCTCRHECDQPHYQECLLYDCHKCHIQCLPRWSHLLTRTLFLFSLKNLNCKTLFTLTTALVGIESGFLVTDFCLLYSTFFNNWMTSDLFRGLK